MTNPTAESCPPIDREVLDILTGGDREFGREAIETFVLELRERQPELRNALTRSDLASVARESHTIKGSASTMGATQLAAIALTMETRGRAGSSDGLDGLANDLEAESARVIDFAAKLLADLA